MSVLERSLRLHPVQGCPGSRLRRHSSCHRRQCDHFRVQGTHEPNYHCQERYREAHVLDCPSESIQIVTFLLLSSTPRWAYELFFVTSITNINHRWYKLYRYTDAEKVQLRKNGNPTKRIGNHGFVNR